MAKSKSKQSTLTPGEATKRAKLYMELTARKTPRWQMMDCVSMSRIFDDVLPFLEGNLKLRVLSAMNELKLEIKKRIILEL